ncbi:right-handed parallel beta-helix repeat-containing protein [Brevibacterium sediminis]|uniref:right-handed parallel beta-helix repeat-containing protein n=1 Tax=Brevibacterium sediminis TaxID=1857024 RepID=UPI003B3A2622
MDRYSATGQFQQVVFSTDSLSPGSHTITIKGTGLKNSSATGSTTIVDSFVVPDTTVVTSLRGEATERGVRLTWDPVTGSSEYNVYRAPAGGTSQRIASVSSGTTRYDDLDATPATLLEYSLRAVVNGQESSSSEPVSVASAAGPGTYENNHEAVRYGGTWTETSSTNDSGGSYHTSNSPSATASFTFVGRSVVWTSRKTGASGINDVYIDGEKVASVDRYNPTGQYQVDVFRATDLAEGVHTITVMGTGRKNAQANGSSTIVDTFRVPKPTAPAQVSGVRSSVTGKGVTLTWKASSDPDVVGYRVFRGTATSGELTAIATVPADATSFLSVDVKGPRTYRFYVRAVDYIDRLSPSWASTQARVSAYSGYDYLGIDQCPGATVTVGSTSSLEAALAAAKPGDVIRLRDGVYKKRFTISVKGTAESPVWICGGRGAVLEGYGRSGGNGIEISDSSHVILSGITVKESLKAVMVSRSDHITVSDLLTHTTGQEAIHLRQNTTDSVVAGNTVRDTGLVTPEYGEGIYVGLHPDNWCGQNDCEPDRSDRNVVADNVISATTAEAVDVKEGSADGWIVGNTIDASATTATSRWIVVRGNGWLISDNVGRGGSITDGILIDAPPLQGYGTNNIVVRNKADLNSSGYAVRVNQRGNFVGCSTNTYSGSARSMTNVACAR